MLGFSVKGITTVAEEIPPYATMSVTDTTFLWKSLVGSIECGYIVQYDTLLLTLNQRDVSKSLKWQPMLY